MNLGDCKKVKNITSVVLDKYHNNLKYQNLGNDIFKDLENKRYVVTLRFELEENEDSQYPLEDILDKYLVNCTNHIFMDENAGILEVEIEDGNDEDFESLKTIEQVITLIGKRVYNKEDGENVTLVIE